MRRLQLRTAQNVAAWTGRVLFLAGTFMMVTGDWPRFLLPPARWSVPLGVLAWPWLYLMLLAVAFVLLVSSGVLRGVRSTTTDFLHPPLALLILTFLLSVACSQAPLLSQWAFGCLLGLVGFALGVSRILEDETCMRWMPNVIAAAALFLAIRVLLWRVDEGLIASAFHVRNNAWLGKIQIAWVLNVVAPFLLGGVFREKRVAAAVSYGVAWLLSGAAIYVLFSKAGAFTFALTTLSLCLLNARSWRRWLPPLVGVIGVLAVLIAASPTMSTRLVASLIRPDQDVGIAMRQGVWRQTFRMIADHPVVGIGLGTYDDIAHSQYGRPADPSFFRNGWHAHNVFLHVLAETGAAGFLAFCYLGLTVVRFLVRRWRDDERGGRAGSAAALCVLLAFVVLSMTEVMIAARVYASLRMNLVLALLVIYGIRLAAPPHAAPTACRGAR